MADAEISIDEFREEALTFLEANRERRVDDKQEFVWGQGSDDVSLFEEVDREAEKVLLAEAQAWRALKYDAGFAWIAGPVEFGGRALPRSYERLFTTLEARYLTPPGGFFGIGLGMVAPTIHAHATPDVQADLLPKMYRGDLVGAQLFSEPNAGSDLASLQTKAVRDGDEWILNGQKVWTSGAHYADVGEIICRTDPDLPKHKGLTGFVFDMHSPGVEVRPLRQMTGGASFNEVYFTDVRVPDSNRLGEVNQGWTVALTTLMNERASIGGGAGSGLGLANVERLKQMLHHFDLGDDPVLRDELARVYCRMQVAKFTNMRAMAKIRAGELPGPEMSIGKLTLTQNLTAIVEWAAQVLGPRVAADTGEWGTYAWGKMLLGVPGMRVAGGTDEVMRNIIAERVLGLPKEPGIDTTSPFRDLLVGSASAD